MFKLKIKEQRKIPLPSYEYLGKRFKGSGDNFVTIYTIVDYDPISEVYYRNRGEGTPITRDFRYTGEDIKRNIQHGTWKFAD